MNHRAGTQRGNVPQHTDLPGPIGLLAPGTKFAVLGLDDCRTVNFTDPIVASDGVSAHSRCPLVVPDRGRKWLGTLTIGHLEHANFVLIIQRPSSTPDTLDYETLEMEQQFNAHW